MAFSEGDTARQIVLSVLLSSATTRLTFSGSRSLLTHSAEAFCTLLIIVVAVRIDILIGTTYVRDATCIGFCVNELLSIVENTSLMGVPYPDAIKKAIDVLQKKAGKMNEDASDILDAIDDDSKQK